MFTAVTAVAPFKRNGLGLALCENSGFILTESPRFCLFNRWNKGMALEAIHRAELGHVQTTGLQYPSAQCN